MSANMDFGSCSSCREHRVLGIIQGAKSEPAGNCCIIKDVLKLTTQYVSDIATVLISAGVSRGMSPAAETKLVDWTMKLVAHTCKLYKI
jgi:hypothetical protein